MGRSAKNENANATPSFFPFLFFSVTQKNNKIFPFLSFEKNTTPAPRCFTSSSWQLLPLQHSHLHELQGRGGVGPAKARSRRAVDVFRRQQWSAVVVAVVIADRFDDDDVHDRDDTNASPMSPLRLARGSVFFLLRRRRE